MTGTQPWITGPALDLSEHRNNTACWAPGAGASDGFDGFGRAFPAHALEPHERELRLPSGFGRGEADNVTCEGQTVSVGDEPTVIAIHVVGAGTQGVVREVFRLHPAGTGTQGADVALQLGDFLTRGHVPGARCYQQADFLYDTGGRPEPSVWPRLWHATARLAEPVVCARVDLPFNPDLHLFGIWLTPADIQGRTP
ncbi:hypothetical protein ACH4TV_29840 [Streptomyces sp. NPDC020898]|uniref:hypothetical protein n=1 Tax=Streptomyces sp. NPDC020898 TaxID=3365101 RepID=UPI0037B2BB4E